MINGNPTFILFDYLSVFDDLIYLLSYKYGKQWWALDNVHINET